MARWNYCFSAKYGALILRRADMQEDPGQLHEAQLIPKSMTQAQAAALETPGALIQYGSFSFPGIPSDVVEIIAPMGSCREAWTGLVGRPVKRDRHGAIKQFKKADVYDFLLPSFGYVAVPLLQVRDARASVNVRCLLFIHISESACDLETHSVAVVGGCRCCQVAMTWPRPSPSSTSTRMAAHASRQRRQRPRPSTSSTSTSLHMSRFD